MHMSNGFLSIAFGFVEDVGSTTVSAMSPVDGEVEVLDTSILTENFLQVVFVNIFGQALNNYLGASDGGTGGTPSAVAATLASVSAISSWGGRSGTR